MRNSQKEVSINTETSNTNNSYLNLVLGAQVSSAEDCERVVAFAKQVEKLIGCKIKVKFSAGESIVSGENVESFKSNSKLRTAEKDDIITELEDRMDQLAENQARLAKSTRGLSEDLAVEISRIDLLHEKLAESNIGNK